MASTAWKAAMLAIAEVCIDKPQQEHFSNASLARESRGGFLTATGLKQRSDIGENTHLQASPVEADAATGGQLAPVA
jgi:hypothetical protein